MSLKSFFEKFRRKSVISLPEKYHDALIHPMSVGLSTIKIGQSLQVTEGWSAVIVVKDKVQDVFPSGEHELCLALMPNTTRILKLSRGKVKKSKDKVEVVLPEKFKCDLYFVSTKLYSNLLWDAGNFRVKSKKYGTYKVNMNGSIDFQVVKSGDFIKLFLYQWSHIPAGKGVKYLSELVSEECNNILSFQSDYTDPRDYLDNAKINVLLIDGLNANFEKYGIKITKVCINDVKLSGKISSQIQNEDINGTQTDESTETIAEQILENNIPTIDDENLKNHNKKRKNQSQSNCREIDSKVTAPIPNKVLVKNNGQKDKRILVKNRCPVCGLAMVDGVCMNCESKKEKTKD